MDIGTRTGESRVAAALNAAVNNRQDEVIFALTQLVDM